MKKDNGSAGGAEILFFANVLGKSYLFLFSIFLLVQVRIFWYFLLVIWNLLDRRYVVPILKFKNLEDLDRLERQGKGISWQFMPDKTYIKKALRFQIRIPFPPGLYRFKTFEEAERWERGWWIKSGATKRTG